MPLLWVYKYIKATNQIIKIATKYGIYLNNRYFSCLSKYLKLYTRFLLSAFVAKYIFHITRYQTCINNNKTKMDAIVNNLYFSL